MIMALTFTTDKIHRTGQSCTTLLFTMYNRYFKLDNRGNTFNIIILIIAHYFLHKVLGYANEITTVRQIQAHHCANASQATLFLQLNSIRVPYPSRFSNQASNIHYTETICKCYSLKNETQQPNQRRGSTPV